MVHSCSIIGCKNRGNKGSTKSFHKFPADLERLLKWVKVVSQLDKTGKPWKPKRSSTVCSDHFVPEDFEMSFQKRNLKYNAVPSVFPHHYPKYGQPVSNSPQKPPNFCCSPAGQRSKKFSLRTHSSPAFRALRKPPQKKKSPPAVETSDNLSAKQPSQVNEAARKSSQFSQPSTTAENHLEHCSLSDRKVAQKLQGKPFQVIKKSTNTPKYVLFQIEKLPQKKIEKQSFPTARAIYKPPVYHLICSSETDSFHPEKCSSHTIGTSEHPPKYYLIDTIETTKNFEVMGTFKKSTENSSDGFQTGETARKDPEKRTLEDMPKTKKPTKKFMLGAGGKPSGIHFFQPESKCHTDEESAEEADHLSPADSLDPEIEEPNQGTDHPSPAHSLDPQMEEHAEGADHHSPSHSLDQETDLQNLKDSIVKAKAEIKEKDNIARALRKKLKRRKKKLSKRIKK